MGLHSKLILAALTTTALLVIAVSSATARNLRISERNFELIWNEALGLPKTKLELIAGSKNFQCRVTLLGHFTENTIVKETTRDQGTINHGEIQGENCEGGTATIKTETMPWGLRYRSFTGTLPIIRSITTSLIGLRLRIREPSGTECEFGTEVGHPLVFIIGNAAEASETGLERSGEPNDVTAERGNRIPLRGEFLCGFVGEGEFGGIGLLRTLPRNALLRITLI